MHYGKKNANNQLHIIKKQTECILLVSSGITYFNTEISIPKNLAGQGVILLKIGLLVNIV